MTTGLLSVHGCNVLSHRQSGRQIPEFSEVCLVHHNVDLHASEHKLKHLNGIQSMLPMLLWAVILVQTNKA